VKTELSWAPYWVHFNPNGKGAPARRLSTWRYLETFLQDASTEVLKSSFLEFPESGLGVQSTTIPIELVSSMVGLDGPANGWPHTPLSGLSLSKD
jgi:hypothetical protein